MKRMYIMLAALGLCAAACTQASKDPFQMALENEIIARTGDDVKVKLDVFERIDSTTFGEELAYRQEVLNLRRSQNEKLYRKYVNERKPNSTAAKRNAINHDDEVIEGLAKMNETLAPILCDIAYYDYHFSGKAWTKDAQSTYQDFYATITPDGRVMSIDNSRKTLHKTLGRVIPGYLELVKSDDDAQEENAD